MAAESASGSGEPRVDTGIFRAAFEHSTVAQAIIGPDATILAVNRAGAALIGYPRDELHGRGFAELVHGDSMLDALDAFVLLADGTTDHPPIDMVLVRKDGEIIEAEVTGTLLKAEDGTNLFLVAATDVSRQRAAERATTHHSGHDPLTELPDRRWFAERLAQALARATRSGSPIAVYFVDLDGFKEVNDRLGHEAGDQALFTVAGRLDGAVRPGDTVARYGGDEFTILCEDIPGEDEAAEIAERIVTAIGRPLLVSEGEVRITASVGVAFNRPGAALGTSLIHAADLAMYAAKEGGKAAYRIVSL